MNRTIANNGSADSAVSSRETLIRSAVALMAEKGFHGTSMSDLEAVSGLGRSSIYHYFRNKEALLAEICNELTQRQGQIAKAIAEEGGPARDALYRLIKALVVETICNRQSALVSLREITFLTGAQRRNVLKLRAEYEEHWRTVLKRAADEKLIREYSEFDLNAILGMVNYSVIWIHRASDMKVDDITERFTMLILQGLS